MGLLDLLLALLVRCSPQVYKAPLATEPRSNLRPSRFLFLSAFPRLPSPPPSLQTPSTMPSLFSSFRSKAIPCSGSSPSARLLKINKSLSMNYYISSPTKECCSVKELDLSIPTVVMLHPVFIASEIWHREFDLRVFCLASLLRGEVRESTGRYRKRGENKIDRF